MPLSDADYTAIGARGLADAGYTNLAVRNPWGMAGTNENINSNFQGQIAAWGRAYVDRRLAGAPAQPWEEMLQGRLFIAGVRDGVNVDQAADQYAAQNGFASAQFHDQMTGGNLLQQFQNMPPLPHPDASNLSLGPNLGGADAVTFPGESSAPARQQSGSGAGGLLLLLGAGLLIFVLARKK